MRTSLGSLLRFYLLSVYTPGRLISPAGAPGARGEPARERRSGLLRKAGVAVLAIVVTVDLGFLFVMMNLAMYESLKPMGLQGLLLLNAASSASMIVLVLGFVTALSTYCMSAAEGALLALPIRPRELLGAKMAVTYLSELALAALLVGVAAAIYGIKEAPGADFYLRAAATALTMPLVPLALSYLILVPLMGAGRLFRDRNVVFFLGGLLGLGFALAFNIYIQSGMARARDPAWLLAHFSGPDAILARIGSAWPPSYLAWKALGPGGAVPWLALAANLAAGSGSVLLVAILLGPSYARSLPAFEERLLRRIRGVKAFIARAMRRRSPGAALFLRELRLMNREPAWLMNGPFVVVLLPLVFAVMYFVQRETFAPLLAGIGGFKAGPGGMLAAAGFGAFTASSMSITCTALSRDAKCLAYLKALPLPWSAYIGAKLLHGLAFAVFGAATGSVGLGLLLALPWAEAAGAFAMALAFSALTGTAGLWLDFANPRLAWDNPVAAVKQNPNAVISILSTMALLGALGALAATLPLGTAGFVALYGGGSALLAAALAALLPGWAGRRMEEIEV